MTKGGVECLAYTKTVGIVAITVDNFEAIEKVLEKAFVGLGDWRDQKRVVRKMVRLFKKADNFETVLDKTKLGRR